MRLYQLKKMARILNTGRAGFCWIGDRPLESLLGGLQAIFPEAATKLVAVIRGAPEAIEIPFGPLNHLDQLHFRQPEGVLQSQRFRFGPHLLHFHVGLLSIFLLTFFYDLGCLSRLFLKISKKVQKSLSTQVF